MLSPRLDATPIKRATLAASRLKTVVHFSFVCLQSLLHLEPGYSTPIANATAAAAKRIVCAIREETEEKKIPLALRIDAIPRLKRLARFSPHCGTLQSRELRSKPDVNLSAIGSPSYSWEHTGYHDQQTTRSEIFPASRPRLW